MSYAVYSCPIKRIYIYITNLVCYTYFIYIIDSRFTENKMFDNLVSGVLNVYRVLFGCFSSTVDTVLALKVATLAMGE